MKVSVEVAHPARIAQIAINPILFIVPLSFVIGIVGLLPVPKTPS